jgi:hypothetical protein
MRPDERLVVLYARPSRVMFVEQHDHVAAEFNDGVGALGWPARPTAACR